MARALGADAERSARAVVAAAERVLAEDAGASMEQIAEAAGLTRITVHRRFANPQALLEALSIYAKQQQHEAIDDARPNSQRCGPKSTPTPPTFWHGRSVKDSSLLQRT